MYSGNITKNPDKITNKRRWHICIRFENRMFKLGNEELIFILVKV